MLIDEKITKKIAYLARIKLSLTEVNEYAKDLSKIFEWMEELKKVDVKTIEPVTSVNKISLFEREDASFKKNIENDEVLKNAPSKENNFFTVPKVIE
ncbi:MAG: Asp-tRNA(Asn)/Glu-tRNA(Gln) amidotransferase GatCAB subunit C [Rickettsiales bacterium]|nr:Asp-tRNA(Asn)/Glu-tRNA(Gln) amidotransferase GatCAB subunit C [Rickettsiales bacterium]|tara:strand:- start:385 stop:675 length:291 start_codon:yes stop_codon:yes gene_type:complete